MTFQQSSLFFFFFNDTATTEIYTLSLHDALPIYTAKPKTPAPIVIDRFQFKQDEIGYLGKRRRHLYVLDVESGDRKSTRLNSSHLVISYAVFCLKKKKKNKRTVIHRPSQLGHEQL